MRILKTSEKQRMWQKEWRQRNPNYHKEWTVKNKNKRREYFKWYFKNYYDDLIQHLEKQFNNKMNWDNYGKRNNWAGYSWHIDHIKPRSLFKYEKPEDEEFKKCWALENLQPMEKIANIKKGNKYIL